MTSNKSDKNSQKLDAYDSGVKQRQTYIAPAILSREPLEAVAAACPGDSGKAQGQSGCTIPSS